MSHQHTHLAEVEFDPELIARYDGSGPRYTSYPAADRFTEEPIAAQYVRALHTRQHARPGAPLSLYVHLPFCDTVCYFCACNKIATKDRGRADVYLDYLEREIALVRSEFSIAPEVSQLHLGGGTPTFLNNAQLSRLMRMLKQAFAFTLDAECSIEIDLRRLNDDALELLAGHGFNRMSIGVQDLDPAVQKAVNRLQPAALTQAALEKGRAVGGCVSRAALTKRFITTGKAVRPRSALFAIHALRPGNPPCALKPAWAVSVI